MCIYETDGFRNFSMKYMAFDLWNIKMEFKLIAIFKILQNIYVKVKIIGSLGIVSCR